MTEVRKYKGRNIKANVSRVDCKKAKGWQVRWPGHSKFFSDNKHGSELKSLSAANQYREANFPGVRTRARPEKGVRVVACNVPNRNTPQYYAEAANPQRGKAPRRVYAGTGNTVTESRIANALKKPSTSARRWLKTIS